ncbi:hypothetical protein ACLB2K_037265 [Fragaria x ananassa]
MKSLCLKMDSGRFWRFVTGRKKELESLRAQMSLALAECVDPARFVLEAISEVFPVNKRSEKSDRGNDLGWACVRSLAAALEHETKESLDELEQREITINQSVEIALVKVEETKKVALKVLKRARSDDEYGEVLEVCDREEEGAGVSEGADVFGLGGVRGSGVVLKQARSDDEYGEVDNNEGLLMEMKSLCLKMDSGRFWRFVTRRKKELESLRAQMSLALAECVDPARFVLEAISEVFPVNKRSEKSDRGNDLGWACVRSLAAVVI